MKTNTLLHRYLASLSPDEVVALAEQAETSVPYLRQLANGHRKAGNSVSARLKRADPRITDEMLRPDLYPMLF